MKHLYKYLIAYAMWAADLILAFWLIIIGRSAFLGILDLNNNGDLRFLNAVGFADKIFLIILGLGWLILSIFVEGYFRNGVHLNVMPQRAAKVTGPIMLVIFCIDLLLVWLGGVEGNGWLRWFILAAELAIGIALLIFANQNLKISSSQEN